MHSTILTLAALAASVTADLGYGTIVNACDYEVDLCNVPSADGVHEQHSTTLSANGGNFSQKWTALANNQGWSMKLSPSSDTATIMQFEYTYANTAPDDLWFDLSYVNGEPFKSDWLISSNSDSCVVKQTAYNNPTDDANGMQPLCSPDVSITVTLCPANSDPIVSAISSVVSAVTSALPINDSSEETTSTPTPTTYSEESSTAEAVVSATAYVQSTTNVATSTSKSPSPTTFATKTTSASLSTEDNGSVVTEVDTVIATDIVTVYGNGHYWPRHEHVHRHPHNRY